LKKSISLICNECDDDLCIFSTTVESSSDRETFLDGKLCNASKWKPLPNPPLFETPEEYSNRMERDLGQREEWPDDALVWYKWESDEEFYAGKYSSAKKFRESTIGRVHKDKLLILISHENEFPDDKWKEGKR
jgi:hypothetical protein